MTTSPTAEKKIEFITTHNPHLQNEEVEFYPEEHALKFKWCAHKLKVKPEAFDRILTETMADTVLIVTKGMAAVNDLFNIKEGEEEEDSREEELEGIEDTLLEAVAEVMEKLTNVYGDKPLPAQVRIAVEL